MCGSIGHRPLWGRCPAPSLNFNHNLLRQGTGTADHLTLLRFFIMAEVHTSLNLANFHIDFWWSKLVPSYVAKELLSFTDRCPADLKENNLCHTVIVISPAVSHVCLTIVDAFFSGLISSVNIYIYQ